MSYSAPRALAATMWPPDLFVELGGEFSGARFHYTEQGVAPPGVASVVLIHGASGNLRDMELSLMESLSRHTRVIAIDRPGHGWSDRTSHPDISNPAVQARAIREALARLGVERPVILGHSWGGAVAAAYALDFPEDTAGILPLSGALYPWPGGVAWYHSVVRTPAIGWLFMQVLVEPAGKLLVEEGVKSNFYPDTPPENYTSKTALPLLFRPHEFRANSEDTSNLKENLARMSTRYESISVPVIIVTGNADHTVSPKLHSYAFHNAVEGSELIKLKGTGHMPHYVRRDIVVDAVLRLARGERVRAGMTTIHADGSVEEALAAE
ncbi:alpha/beta fold hydrolase [Parvibaculum lavamentivorans]|uniref:alpha/beta fold hydrolase n=1 Tax=Parvibaculum lavamentivorans TaxID=256618 RepID=UPI0002E2D04D|nr:alpha/beta hydrolase [Parvibaculum lavamentivorans]